MLLLSYKIIIIFIIPIILLLKHFPFVATFVESSLSLYRVMSNVVGLWVVYHGVMCHVVSCGVKSCRGVSWCVMWWGDFMCGVGNFVCAYVGEKIPRVKI